jgi:16S rRNA (guanine1516-N2)-methyltransferase
VRDAPVALHAILRAMPSRDSYRAPAARAHASVAILGDAALARELGVPLAQENESGFDFLLAWTGAYLELRDCRDAKLNPLHISFVDADFRRYSASLSRRQPLARAIGKAQLVADATSGLAQDAFRLALMGYRVTAIERCAAVAALVRDGLRRLNESPHALGERLQLLVGDARALLPTLVPRPEVVYLDPMFPAKRNASAAVRKELAWLRELVGEDPDALELFEAARRTATNRVVVKRPDHAPPLVPNPAASIAGKLVRYDIYSTRIA